VDKYIELIPETRKEWIAPELSKVDIKKITASNGGYGGDGAVQDS
jgi:hypothetical protein